MTNRDEQKVIARLESVLKETGLRNSDLAARAEQAEAEVAHLQARMADIMKAARYGAQTGYWRSLIEALDS